MSARGPLLVCVVFVAMASAAVANIIILWEGDPEKCEISQGEKTVLIQASGRYGLMANEDNAGDGEIEWIKVDPNSGVAGTVYLIIANGGDPNEPGAANIHEIDLSAAGHSDIELLRLGNDLGDPNDNVLAVNADVISGDFRVQGHIIRDIEIEELHGDLWCRSMRNFTATLGGAERHTGNIVV